MRRMRRQECGMTSPCVSSSDAFEKRKYKQHTKETKKQRNNGYLVVITIATIIVVTVVAVCVARRLLIVLQVWSFLSSCLLFLISCRCGFILYAFCLNCTHPRVAAWGGNKRVNLVKRWLGLRQGWERSRLITENVRTSRNSQGQNHWFANFARRISSAKKLLRTIRGTAPVLINLATVFFLSVICSVIKSTREEQEIQSPTTLGVCRPTWPEGQLTRAKMVKAGKDNESEVCCKQSVLTGCIEVQAELLITTERCYPGKEEGSRPCCSKTMLLKKTILLITQDCNNNSNIKVGTRSCLYSWMPDD